MSEPRFTAEQLARSGYFEPLGHGLLCLATCYWLWHGVEDSTPEEGYRNVFQKKLAPAIRRHVPVPFPPPIHSRKS